jgi:MYXO-CTERM domain-containing protein
MKALPTRLWVFAMSLWATMTLLVGTAFAAGSITYAKKEIHEENGGWHIQMTIVYGGKPNTPHVPMRFSFTPTAIQENYLDDAHGDRPQKRTIPLVGQMPNNESVDVDFSDPRGKLFDRTRFDFTVSRAHNFSAGEYSVTVHRADGVQVGTAQTLRFTGDNPVIDRRSISFVGNSGKKDKDKDKAAAASDTAQGASDTKPAAGGEADKSATPAADTAAAATDKPTAEPGNDPAAQEKVPPSSKGCGCRTVGDGPRSLASVATLALGLSLARLRRRRSPVCPSPEEKGTNG